MEQMYSHAILKGEREQPPATQFINRAYDMAEYELRRAGCERFERKPLHWLEPDEDLPEGGWQVLVIGDGV